MVPEFVAGWSGTRRVEWTIVVVLIADTALLAWATWDLLSAREQFSSLREEYVRPFSNVVSD